MWRQHFYDPFHRRLSTKKLEKQGRTWHEVSFEKYLWSGETELGSLNKSGKITSLRVFGEGLGGEIGAAVLFEVNGKPYIPLHDLCGHLRASLDKEGNLAETLSYTAFTLESRSSNISPWSFSSKRQDELTGLFYFGRRFYDQETAGWLSQDPIGIATMNPESKSQEDAIDFDRAMSFPETNLYAYVSNNPLMLIDVFGLSEEIGGMRNMFEARGRDGADAWEASDRGARTVDILEITSALAGITHGAVDFTVDYLQDLQIAAAYMGSEDIGTCEEKIQMIADIQYAQACQMAALDHMLMGLMSVEETDAVYQAYRSATVTGLEVASLVAGGYGVARGVIGASRLVRMPGQALRLTKTMEKAEIFVNRGRSFAGCKRHPLCYAPYQEIRNGPVVINGRRYTGHALDRMQDRGLMPSVVENILKLGRVSSSCHCGELRYYDPENQIRVILGEVNQVITVIPGRG